MSFLGNILGGLTSGLNTLASTGNPLQALASGAGALLGGVPHEPTVMQAPQDLIPKEIVQAAPKAIGNEIEKFKEIERPQYRQQPPQYIQDYEIPQRYRSFERGNSRPRKIYEEEEEEYERPQMRRPNQFYDDDFSGDFDKLVPARRLIRSY